MNQAIEKHVTRRFLTSGPAWSMVTMLLLGLPAGCATPNPVSPKPVATSLTATATTTVYLVRHAEKASERGDPELTEVGKQRASTLAWMLRDVAIDAVYSTNFRRTRDTAAPTATAHGIDITTYASNDELIQSIRNTHAGETVLICGHSNTIPQILSKLGVPIQDEILPGYDDLFVVTLRTNENPQAMLQRLHYVRTPKP